MHFEYELTRSDYDQAGRLEGRERGSRLPVRVAYAACAAGFLLWVKQHEVAAWIAPALLIGFGLFLIVQPTLNAYEQAERLWNENGRIRRPVSVDAGSSGLSLRSDLVEVHYNWNMFDHAAETSDLFLIYQTPSSLVAIIPKRSVPTGQDLDELRRFLKLKVTEPAPGFPVVCGDDLKKDG